MSYVVVERSFETPVDLPAISAQEKAFGWCLETHRVRFLLTYVAADRSRMLCIYDAPDAEAMRATQREAAMPFDRIWAAQLHGQELPKAPEGKETVVVTRTHGQPVSMEQLARVSKLAGGCMQVHRVDPLGALLCTSGLRQVCLFAAPDAEAVRVANHQSQLPVDEVFKANVFRAS